MALTMARPPKSPIMIKMSGPTRSISRVTAPSISLKMLGAITDRTVAPGTNAPSRASATSFAGFAQLPAQSPNPDRITLFVRAFTLGLGLFEEEAGDYGGENPERPSPMVSETGVVRVILARGIDDRDGSAIMHLLKRLEVGGRIRKELVPTMDRWKSDYASRSKS